MDREKEQSAPASAFPFESRFIRIGERRIHYVEQGKGDPVLFVHGNPTSSYLWRNILPPVAEHAGMRGIALDLLGFGKSDKPDDVDYTMRLHADILEEFIGRLGLAKIVLILHDWGGPIGMWYAVHHPGDIRGIALMETFLWDMSWKDFGKFGTAFRLFRSSAGYVLIQVLNVYLNRVLPGSILHKEHVTPAVLYRYQEPFPTVRSRKAVRRFPQLLPIEGDPVESWLLIKRIEENLSLIQAPVLWIKATPGAIVTSSTEHHLKALLARLPHMTISDFGPGLHCLQEDDPGQIVALLLSWMRQNGLIGAEPARRDYRQAA